VRKIKGFGSLKEGTMNKTIIKAKEALEDIRAGMNDIALMKKYKLSAQGLQRLFKKLGEAGIIRHLNAYEVIADLKAGISNEDLMKKYKLNAHGVHCLLEELDKVGLMSGTEDHRTIPTKLAVNIRQVVVDIKSGLTKTQLMHKYRLSPRGLRWLSMTLISSGAISWQEIYDKLCTTYEELVPDKLRQTTRYTLPFDCHIYSSDDLGALGKVRDISEHGLGIFGVKANVGDTKTLTISEEEFGEFAAFTFDAECRWIRKEPGGFGSGFEISHISIGNLKEFQLLHHLAKFGHNGKKSPSSRRTSFLRSVP
jgi:hypothetical protein